MECELNCRNLCTISETLGAPGVSLLASHPQVPEARSTFRVFSYLQEQSGLPVWHADCTKHVEATGCAHGA
jgi:hypothetical protein